MQKLKPIIESDKILKVLVNAKFDYKMMVGNYGWHMNNVRDVMLNEMCLHNGKRKFGYSLKALAKRYLNYSYDDPQLKLFGNDPIFKDTGASFTKLGKKQFSKEQIIYGAKDVEFALQIYHRQLPKLNKIKNLIWLENEFLLAMADMEFNGMPFNSRWWLDNEQLYHKKLDEAEEKLAGYLPEEFREIN
jgi:DNA polymerase-1